MFSVEIFGTFIFNLCRILDTQLCFKATQVFNLKLSTNVKKKIPKQYCLIYEHRN